MTNPFQDYLNDLVSRCEQSMPVYQPTCCECQAPITGTNYNGRCYICAMAEHREDQASTEAYWKEINEP